MLLDTLIKYEETFKRGLYSFTLKVSVRRGHDRMVVEVTTIYAISAYLLFELPVHNRLEIGRKIVSCVCLIV
jgi:hypothetical protein